MNIKKFSFIELLVVIAIIAILAGMLIPFIGLIQKTKTKMEIEKTQPQKPERFVVTYQQLGDYRERFDGEIREVLDKDTGTIYTIYSFEHHNILLEKKTNTAEK